MEKKVLKEFKRKNQILRIYQDDCDISPREFDSNGIMVCFHKRYNLPNENKHINSDDFEGWEQLEQFIKTELKALVVLPIFMYDHSGITVSTKPFSCSWDSGQIGFIYTTEERLKELGHTEIPTIGELTEWLINEVIEYDQYLTGNMYRFELSETETWENGETFEDKVDYCSGFYNINDVFGHIEGDKKEWIEV